MKWLGHISLNRIKKMAVRGDISQSQETPHWSGRLYVGRPNMVKWPEGLDAQWLQARPVLGETLESLTLGIAKYPALWIRDCIHESPKSVILWSRYLGPTLVALIQSYFGRATLVLLWSRILGPTLVARLSSYLRTSDSPAMRPFGSYIPTNAKL
jgi:hypothetical protein